MRLAALSVRLRGLGGQAVTGRRHRLISVGGRLDALSPLAVLRRGYAIVTRKTDGAVLRAAADVRAGDEVGVRLAQGRLRASVVAVDALGAEDPPPADA
jgi:exodeoxyribonuclease VII large subunit